MALGGPRPGKEKAVSAIGQILGAIQDAFEQLRRDIRDAHAGALEQAQDLVRLLG